MALGPGGGGENGDEAIAPEADDIAGERGEIAKQGVEVVHRERFVICWVGAFAGGLALCASFKTDTTALVERSKTVPVLANLFKLPHLLLLGGGIVIKVSDEVVGAIGAAGAPGGDLDDACAHAGLDKIKDQLK